MEDYNKFVQHRLSQLRKSKRDEEEPCRPSFKSSLIRFYGRPILPPLLSEKQKAEMQRHRHEVQKATGHRQLKEDPRMTYVQTILHSIQLRKTPTLEQLLQESEINADSSHRHDASSRSASHGGVFDGTKESPSPTPERKLNNNVSLPPLTSTTYSAFFASHVSPQHNYHEGCLIDQPDSQQGSQPCSFNRANQHALSSGYVTYENVENTTAISGEIDSGGESHCVGHSEEAYAVDGFFLHSISNAIAKMPDIINHPPIDGEELERSGLESSFCNNLMGVKDICHISFQDDSVICDHTSAETSLHSMQHADKSPFTTILDPANHENTDRNEGSVDFLDSPELSQTLSTPHRLITELHVQQSPSEPEPVDIQIDKADTKTSEDLYPLSLQALLKKSQEYRRRQRMLRNRAKNTKIQEGTQEQPRGQTEEQSLSDKENDEFPYKGTVTAAGKKTKERSGTFVPSLETSPQKSWENEGVTESEVTWKKTNLKTESTHVPADGNTKKETSTEEETTLKNNMLNSSQEFATKPKQISAFIQQQPVSPEVSLVHDAFNGTTCLTGFYKGEGKYRTFPTPNFCRSPVHCRSKGSLKDGQVAEGAKTSGGKLVVSHHVTDKVEEANLRHQNSLISPSAVDLLVEGDVTSVLAKSSQHIDQLESNLSSLKVLISDLESTVKENLDNHCLPDNDMQNESSFKGIKHPEQTEKDLSTQRGQNDFFSCGEDKQGGDVECRERLRRPPLINVKNIHEESGPEPSISDREDVLSDQEREADRLKLNETKQVKTSAPEREKGLEGLAKSYAQSGSCRKHQLPVKNIQSVAQQMRIPNIFRNIPSENMVHSDLSVLSDTSNHPVQRRSEMTVEGQRSIHSPSLNRSYDVDTPSGLWLLEGSGSGLGSQSHLCQEKHLTPESEGEDQGGKLKVKRRLLMHVTKEMQERNEDVSKGADSVVRPSSSTPRAAVRLYESRDSQRDKEEQLKLTHAAQVRALQDEHRKQQEELLQALAARYSLLQNMSFPCSMSNSRLGETLTFSALSQPLSPLSQHYRPLLAAAVRGFLTRRLLRTERVAQLVRTIRDTQQFLQALKQQSVGKGEFCSRQDDFLQERVALQLRAARYEVYDVFFGLSARERMQLISWDRELTRDRELRRQNGHTDCPRGKSSLSAATRKSLERKRGTMIQKKATERHGGVMARTGQKSGFSAEKPQETKRGQFKANPQRVPKSACSSRPR
ncbi:uncharacterized protein cp110 [Leuresthes tenuis]|uniref:uncharacterized protein cp110 n=1 Tax=Leuresthes tenuis TaxID=355514 RepID=UPI003B512078